MQCGLSSKLFDHVFLVFVPVVIQKLWSLIVIARAVAAANSVVSVYQFDPFLLFTCLKLQLNRNV